MTTHARKPRRDSAESIAQALFERAQGPVPIPRHVKLSPQAKRFWPHITEARPRTTWRAHELVLVGQACRVMAQLESIALRDDKTMTERRERDQLLRHEIRLLRALRVIGSQAERMPKLPPVPSGDLLAD